MQIRIKPVSDSPAPMIPSTIASFELFEVASVFIAVEYILSNSLFVSLGSILSILLIRPGRTRTDDRRRVKPVSFHSTTGLF